MGSIKPTKTKRGYFGKVESSLNEKLGSVEWGEFRVGDLFEINKTQGFNKIELVSGSDYDYITRTSGNQGILQETGLVPNRNINPSGVWSLGLLQMDFFYRRKPWYAGQFIRMISPKFKPTKNSVLYFSVLLNKLKTKLLSVLVRDVESMFVNSSIQLPVKQGKPDFELMDNFIAELEAERIAELEAYLEVTGLSDCELTEDEQKVLDDFANDEVTWGKFSYQSLFSNIQQGRRLKKDDQKPGNLPFVMSGVTNTGVINHIANSVFRFPKNSITVDIFGNAFYRNYDFGAGDDTGVYWNAEKEHSKNAMLFIASSLERSIFGKFSYGKKLRSSQSLNFQAMLPSLNIEPDYLSMELLISAIQKIVIKDVVEYTDKKIQ
ncbi:restriction endonuclease subunit S, partial [Vibrio mediterranei]